MVQLVETSPPRKRRRDDTTHRPSKHKRPSVPTISPTITTPEKEKEKDKERPRVIPRCHVCSRAQSVGFGTITVCGACGRETCYVCTRRCDGCAETVCSGCCEERGVQCFCGRCAMV